MELLKIDTVPKTIGACVICGALIIGGCGFVTKGTLDSMREQAIAAMISSEEGQPSISTDTPVDGILGVLSDADASDAFDENGNGDVVVVDAESTQDTETKDADESGQGADATGNGSAAAQARDAQEDTVTAPDGSVYHIQYGDTLSYISDTVGYSVDELAHYNEIDDVNVIYADSALRVPSES